MTTPSTARKAGPLLGNGSTTAFPFTFKVFAAADVAVTIANSSGVETPLVLNTDYSVTLNGNQDTSPGGTITYPISGAALPSGSKLSIVGDIDYDQPLDLPSGGNFSPLALENQLDRATMQIQQLAEGLSRAAQLPVTNSEDPATLVADIVRLADSADNIDTLVANLADIATVADDLNEPVSEINTVAVNIANVNNVGSNITNVNTVAGISANVTTVAGIAANVTTVAGVAANVTTVAGVSAAVTAVAAIDDDVTIAAANVADITNFADVYQGPKTSDPTLRNDGSALQVGDLYFNTVEQALRTYGGTQWVSGTAGTVAVQQFSGNGSTVAFTLATAPAGENNTQVYISGVYQQKDQYSVSGTTLTFSTAPPSGTNNIEVVTISTLAIGETDASLVAFLPAGTGAVATTVQSKLRESVSVKDFGVKGDGTDETVKIQAALDSGACSVYFPAGTYYITSAINPSSNQKLFGDGAASHIQLKDGTHNGIYADGKTGIQINDLKFSCKTATGGTAYIGAVSLKNCTDSLVENIYVTQMGFWGVALQDCSRVIVTKCRFDSFFSTIQDSADIQLRNDCIECIVSDNYCYAQTNSHGIMLWEPYSGAHPSGNTILNNRIQGHTAYGIIVYTTLTSTPYDTKTVIRGNRISGVTGSAISGASGAGIYLLAGGGTIIDGNHVTNCCISTSNFGTLNMAHIVANAQFVGGGPDGAYGGKEVIITNNNVECYRGPGISTSTCGIGPIISNNVVTCKTAASYGIKAQDSHYTKIINNKIRTLSADAGIVLIATNNAVVGSVFYGADVRGNYVNCATKGVYFYKISGTFTNANVSDNIIFNGNSQAIYMDTVTNAIVSGNSTSSSEYAFSASDVVNLRMTNNHLKSSRGWPNYGIGFLGTTSGVVDESNSLEGVIIHNTTGVLNISMYGNSIPAFGTGYYGIGDRVIQSVPVVGSPKGWRCTAAGAVGTWVSEGNL
jgi:hypothetical protein